MLVKSKNTITLESFQSSNLLLDMEICLFLALISTFVWASEYELLEDYKPEEFTDKFNFYVKGNVSDDFVNYVDREVAIQTGLFKV